jgi:hypothetical protein
VLVAIFTMLSGCMGLWAGTSAHRSVVRAYYLVMLPVTVVFNAGVAVQCLYTVAMHTNEGNTWSIVLLMGGVYLVFIAIFQLFSMASARFRSLVMLRQRDLESIGDTAGGTHGGGGKKHIRLTFGLNMLRAGTDKARERLEGDMGVRLAGKNHIVRRRTAGDRLIVLYSVCFGTCIHSSIRPFIHPVPSSHLLNAT